MLRLAVAGAPRAVLRAAVRAVPKEPRPADLPAVAVEKGTSNQGLLGNSATLWVTPRDTLDAPGRRMPTGMTSTCVPLPRAFLWSTRALTASWAVAGAWEQEVAGAVAAAGLADLAAAVSWHPVLASKPVTRSTSRSIRSLRRPSTRRFLLRGRRVPGRRT